mmetsp:Transcript_64060/g.187437  ORF Transcript_64060/g.187437 Transcript_64060/m.187437 type:complete len:354 (+) Transcript_64060:171-1232(+)
MESSPSHHSLANGEPNGSGLHQTVPSPHSSMIQNSPWSSSSFEEPDASPKTIRRPATPDAGQPWRLPITATLFHLLAIEPFPVYTFYISFITLLGELVTFLEFWYEDVHFPVTDEYRILGKWINCAKNDVYGACFSFDLGFKGECLADDDPNYLGFVNAGCVVICLSIGFCQSVHVAWNKEFDFCSGGYLASKWDFEGTIVYRVVAPLLLVYTLFTLITAGYITGTTLSAQLLGDLTEAFLFYQSAPVMLLLISAAVLASPSGRMPVFNYRREDFRRLRFRRTWRDLCFEDSTALARRLERAILLAELGRRGELEAMLVDRSMADEVLRMAMLEEELEDEGSHSEASESENGR